MSMYECEKCGGAVGLFCVCQPPAAPNSSLPQGALTAEQIETAAAAVGLHVAAVVAFRRSNGQNMTVPEKDGWDATVRFANTIAALASAQPAPQAEPAAWVSPEQFEAHPDGGPDGSGRYLPMRKSMAGKFTMPLFAAAPSLPPAGDRGMAS